MTSMRDELWEAYSAGLQNGVNHATEGEEPEWDAVREDFDVWYRGTADLWDIAELDLTVRCHNAFYRAGLRTIGQVRYSLSDEAAHSWPAKGDVPYCMDIKSFGVGMKRAAEADLARHDERLAR